MFRQQMVRFAGGRHCWECGDSFGRRCSPGGAACRQYLGPPWLTSDLGGRQSIPTRASRSADARNRGSTGARTRRDQADNVIAVATERTTSTNNISTAAEPPTEHTAQSQLQNQRMISSVIPVFNSLKHNDKLYGYDNSLPLHVDKTGYTEV